MIIYNRTQPRYNELWLQQTNFNVYEVFIITKFDRMLKYTKIYTVLVLSGSNNLKKCLKSLVSLEVESIPNISQYIINTFKH